MRSAPIAPAFHPVTNASAVSSRDEQARFVTVTLLLPPSLLP